MWNELKSWPRGMQVLCGGLIMILITCLTLPLVLMALGYGYLAGDLVAWLSPLLTLAWMFGMFLWVVFVDSKKRWPNATTFERYTNVITFKR